MTREKIKEMMEERFNEINKVYSEVNIDNFKPRPLFTDNELVFNENNWNSNQDIIVEYFNEIWSKYYGQKTFMYDNYNMLIRVIFNDNDWHGWIIKKNIYDPDDTTTYYAGWKFNVPKVDKLLVDGNNMRYEEYVDILSILFEVKQI